ncbi:MAG: TIGR00375 family protein [Candidatus Diapherotrites archaeon]|nr:TIGR00375 family protein [Candidatus Diapherotrites archaeon]
MKSYNCDLQLHGMFAAGVSKNMAVPVIAEQAKLKGLHVLVTGDIFHKQWFAHLKENVVEEENGVFADKNRNAFFIVGGEVEDKNRIHHLIYLPDFASALSLREKFFSYGNLDCVLCGRPKLNLSAEPIAQKVLEFGGIIGPAHAFTPYTGLYAFFDSAKKAYGEMGEKLLFIELGLSADTDFADTISENHKYSFLSSSDAHSPWPNRIGREFNRIKMKKPDYKNLVKALKEKEEKLIELNAGLNPLEGKYHKTACNNCFTQYELKQAEQFRFLCARCGSQIKRGVRDRIEMLADTKTGVHPAFRPPYLHLLPLAEIIQLSAEVKNVNSQAVQSVWMDFVERFGNEINVLVDVSIKELAEVNTIVAKKIESFRNGLVLYIPGGGGKYGTPIICDSKEEFEKTKKELEQKTFSDPLKGQKSLAEF